MPVEITERVSENGARLLSAPMRGTPSFAIFLSLRVGSRDDPEESSGLAHLLEHLAFKGTATRPTAADVARDLDRVGADFNAFTGREWMSFYVRCASEDAAVAIEVLFDMVVSSTFSVESVEREKSVVSEELRVNSADLRGRVDDLMHSVMFAGSGLARPVGGTVADVRRIERPAVVQFVEKTFRADNVVVGLAGTFTCHDEDRAFSLLAGIPSAPRTPARVVARDRHRSHGEVEIVGEHVDSELVHMAYSMAGWEASNENRYAVGLLHTILGGGLGSRLFRSLREQRAWSYYVGADHATYRDSGTLNVRVAVQPGRVLETIEVITKELADAVREIHDDELERAARYARGRLLLGVSDPRGMLLFLLRRACTDGAWEDPWSVGESLMKVTRTGVIDALEQALCRPPTVFLVGSELPREVVSASDARGAQVSGSTRLR
ncbi:pitrilysin family protein [uncultured Microbacterium sp.]|uniref:M16 family metallopeptidase n=1 Tax=uncultured Microbacterium sp. TaxID=191216 RepID=UPI0028D4AF04|nr:pitrilysin family protein [uncultured Microbacterium sp.]